MSVASEISKLNTNLLNAYTTIGTKGGTVPANKNSDNLQTAIASIPAGSIGTTDSSILITEYNTTTGVITGQNFGSTGKVYLLDRDTHTYNELSTSSYTNTSITLTTPINRATIQGNTCFYVQPTDKGVSNKFMVYGDGTLTVPQWGLVYVQNESTRAITKITMTNSTDLAKLQGSNNVWGNKVTINGTDVYKSQIVGVQFGDGITSYTVPTIYLGQLVNLNQPVVIPSGMSFTTSSTYFMRYDYMFDCPVVFTTQNRVGSYFMNYCQTFNQPLDISMFSYMNATYFMQSCSAFNQKLKLPTTLTTTTIGNYFMYNCRSFNQDLTLPSNLTGFGNYFLSGCYAFNSKITFGSSLTTIGTYFLQNCYVFNQPLTFPSTVTSISNYFLNSCSSFNSKLTMPNVTTIGVNFMASCGAYNQDTDFLSKVTSIGNYFFSQAFSYNKPITLNTNLTTIGTNFMAHCESFNYKLTIPSNATSIGIAFMDSCYSFGELEVNNNTSPTDNNTLSVAYENNRNYQGGITVTGTGATTWKTNLPNRTASPYRKLI